jgi:hypothetical protein
LSEIIPLVVLGVIAAAFLTIYVRSRTRKHDPAGVQPLYDEACSLIVPRRFGFQFGSNVAISRAKLFPGVLIVSGVLNVEIPIGDVVSVTLARRWFSQGVRLETLNERARELFLFLPRPREFASLVEQQRRQCPIISTED